MKRSRPLWRPWLRLAVAGLASCLLVVVVGAQPSAAATSTTLLNNDYNRDGISDILAVNQASGCLYRWSGNGHNGFGAAAQLGCGWGSAFFADLTAVGDLNRDGNGDVVAIDGICLFRWSGNGTGGLGGGTELGCGGWNNYDLGSAGDLNGDGVADLVGINVVDNCLYRWFGNGTGGFGAGVKVGCGWSNFERTDFLYRPLDPITGVGDINHDGKADIVARANSGPSVGDYFAFYGHGDGTFATAVNEGPIGDQIFAGMGDINSDGQGDLVGILGDGLDIYNGNGTGGLHYTTNTGAGWSAYNLVA